MSTIIDELRNLNRPEIIDREHPVTATDVSAVVCSLLVEIGLEDAEEDEKLTEWVGLIRESRCKAIAGAHSWVPDMCYYWGHQYCVGCHKSKYPELAKLRCSEAVAKIGDITEDEYRKRVETGTS